MTWIVILEWLARLVMLFLIGLSVWSISIIIDRYRYFSAWLKNSGSSEDPRVILKKDLQKVPRGASEPFYRAFVNQKTKTWRQGLSVLGTLGSISPFIGLLGTVLGIIVTFGELSQGKAQMKDTLFSLAEALVLTAVGLIVAIPAVIAFNYFNRRIREMLSDLETVKDQHVIQQMAQQQEHTP